jgi:hypothetical protein
MITCYNYFPENFTSHTQKQVDKRKADDKKISMIIKLLIKIKIGYRYLMHNSLQIVGERKMLQKYLQTRLKMKLQIITVYEYRHCISRKDPLRIMRKSGFILFTVYCSAVGVLMHTIKSVYITN